MEEEEKNLHSLSKEQLITIILQQKRSQHSNASRMEIEKEAIHPSSTTTQPSTQSTSTGSQKASDDSTNNNNNSQKQKNNKKNTREREFNMERYSQRHIALKIAYLGWNYSGFASQDHTENTVEVMILNRQS